MTESTDNRIAKALSIAPDGMHDGAHHKDWVIDQIVRALTGCPVVTKTATDYRGQEYDYEAQGESTQYKAFVAANDGWSEGVAP